MERESVAQIGLDLTVNSNQFNRQMQGIQGLAKKAGAALAAAFAVKKLINFGASCVQLGSDLEEVQNVVDVTFKTMSGQVNRFAQEAAASFGLSETMAKKFTGTFGAMAKSFGFNEQAVYEMSTALTGLSGDVASFYNISQDEAFTKLKSIFSGETESLKDLGIVMAQAALDQYALANGYGKTTAKMSESEKVALRYKFVQEQLTLASGDFIRTSEGWANQVRILKLQFDNLKTTIGQGLINVLTPVIKVINLIINKIMVLANAFKALTEMLSKKKSDGGKDSGVGEIADQADGASEALEGVEKSAKKAKKATASMGIDELNVISADSGDDSGDSGGAGGEMDFGEIDTSGLEEQEKKYSAFMEKLINRMKELGQLFKEGFEIGFGDSYKNIESMKQSLASIKQSLIGIFTDPAVTTSMNNLLNSIALNFGKIAGSFASIGTTIGANLLGGTALYLEQNEGFIKERLVKIFDTQSEVLTQTGDFCTAFADVLSVFANEDGKQITADIIGIFSNAALGITEIINRDFENVVTLFTQPFIDCKDSVKEALEGTLEPVSTITTSIREFVTGTFEKISEVYDTYIDPAFERFTNGFTTIFQAALDAYNKYLLPVLDWISERFSLLMEKYVAPLRDSFLELWGKCVEAVSMFWEFISPFVGWFVEKFIAVISTKIQWLWTKFEAVFALIASALRAFMDILSGIIDFVVGVFTGNWEKAWEGIKKIFSARWELIKNIIQIALDFISNLVTTVMNAINSTISVILSAIKTTFEAIWETIKNLVQTVITAVKDTIFNALENIKGIWSTAWNGIKIAVEMILSSIRVRISGIINTIKEGISSSLANIRSTWDSIWGKMKDSVIKIFNGIWNGIKGVINAILGGIEKMANGVIRGINKMIEALNGLNFEIPDWVPGIGGKGFGIKIPTLGEISIPKLAQGGYVKANTPQLAMIGDNRHQGEVVAPEDKLQEMVNRAVTMASGTNLSDQYLASMVTLLKELINLVQSLDLTVYIDVREIKKRLVDLEKRAGFVF